MEERIVTRRWFLRTAVMAAAAATGLTIVETSVPAAAMPLPPLADPALDPLVPDEDDNIHLAQTNEQRRRRRRRRRNRSERRRWRYARGQHGRRYRRRRGGYTHYYGGYYYSRPWWTIGPGIVIDLSL